MGPLEIGANALNTISILLAGRNSVHTWWTGILGCIAFTAVFYTTRLYADVTLQVFFVFSSGIGWWRWRRTRTHPPAPVRFSDPWFVATLAIAGSAATAGYGWLLHRFTDAYAPFLDSAILAFSVLATFLLVARRVESWWCWLIVNTVAVPLYASRELYLTAVLYAGYWINALVSLRHWHRLAKGAV